MLSLEQSGGKLMVGRLWYLLERSDLLHFAGESRCLGRVGGYLMLFRGVAQYLQLHRNYDVLGVINLARVEKGLLPFPLPVSLQLGGRNANNISLKTR